jgi:hypothetical protein
MPNELSNAAIVEDIRAVRAEGIVLLFRNCRADGVTMETIQELITIANGIPQFPGVFWYDRLKDDFCYGADQ